MADLAKKSRHARFDAQLPPSQPDAKNNYNDNRFVNKENEYIPESVMAKKLRNELAGLNILINNESSESGNNSNSNVTVHVSEICNSISVAFESLYNKYVNSQSAIFEINIASRNRLNWMRLFDTSSYHRKHQSVIYSTLSILTIDNRNSNDNKNNNGNNKNSKNNKNETKTMNFLREEVKKRYDEASKNNENGKEILVWMLNEIMETVEPSVHEISVLMNDSFSRFLRDNQDFVATLHE